MRFHRGCSSLGEWLSRRIAPPLAASLVVLIPVSGTFCTVSAAPQFRAAFHSYDLTVAGGLAIADLDHDGHPDIISTVWPGYLSVQHGNGDGTFAPALDYDPALNDARWLALGDVTGDGKTDVVVSGNQVNGYVTVMPGNGDGTFLGGTRSQTFDESGPIALGDLNGDGKLDLVVDCAGSGNPNPAAKVSIFLNTGSGYGLRTDFLVGGLPGQIALADMNHDGRLDLIVCNRTSNVTIYPGNGSGGFGAGNPYPTNTDSYGLAVGDVNGDGILDVVTANNGSSSVSVLLGAINGTLVSSGNFPVGYGPTDVQIADLNGDGRLDLAVSDYNGNSVTVLLGDALGSFGSRSDLWSGYSSRVRLA